MAATGAFASVLVAVFASTMSPAVRLGGAFFLDGLSGVFLIAVAFVYAVVAIYSAGYMRPASVTSGCGVVLAAAEPVRSGTAGDADRRQPRRDVGGGRADDGCECAARDREGSDQSVEAGWKYIVIGSAGLALGLLGIVLIYAAGVPSLGDHYTPTYSTLAGAAPHLNRALVHAGFAFALVGFGTKVGLVPMHAWLPDAHSEGPSPISAMLSGALLAAALYAVLRLGAIAQITVGPSYVHVLLLVFGGTSLVLAALFALRQTNYKRLLAYSSIEHMGIVSLGSASAARSPPTARSSTCSCTPPARRSPSSAPASS